MGRFALTHVGGSVRSFQFDCPSYRICARLVEADDHSNLIQSPLPTRRLAFHARVVRADEALPFQIHTNRLGRAE